MGEKKSSPPVGMRFGFGKNWSRYIELVNEDRVNAAQDSLARLFNGVSLEGMSFLDVGSGSGLFSLAARNLGASVTSFDYDWDSVNCTLALKDRYWSGDERWHIERGDALDEAYLASLGRFDVVYSWGVLHHTGDMWRALSNVASNVKSQGLLLVALYNDQGWLSKYWKGVKKLYNGGPLGRSVAIATHAPYFLFRYAIKALVTGSTASPRGMDPWRDILDWLGGYPFEVASPEDVFAFYHSRGFSLEDMSTVGGRLGCNEFLFRAPERSA